MGNIFLSRLKPPEAEYGDIKDLTDLALSLPIITKGRLFHVGCLQNPNQSHGDLEGPLLSVTTHPEAWREILLLDKGYEPPITWSIETQNKEPFLFIDMFKCQWAKNKPYLEWAENRGLIEKKEQYLALVSVTKNSAKKLEPETNQGSYSSVLTDSLEEALLLHDPSWEKPKTVENFVMTQKLKDFWNQRKKSPWTMRRPEQIHTAILCALLSIINDNGNKNSKSSHKKQSPVAMPVGLWWQEPLNVQKAQAPRGGIYPNTLEENWVKQLD